MLDRKFGVSWICGQGGGGAGATLKVKFHVVAQLALSVITMLKLKTPLLVGVPLNTPAEVSDIPGGTVVPVPIANV